MYTYNNTYNNKIIISYYVYVFICVYYFIFII